MRDLDRKALMILLQQHLDAISGTDIAHARHSEGGIQLAKKIVNLKNAAEWLLHDLSAAREQSRQPQEGAGQGEAVEPVTAGPYRAAIAGQPDDLDVLGALPDTIAQWVASNLGVELTVSEARQAARAALTSPPDHPAQAELDRLRDRVAALEGALIAAAKSMDNARRAIESGQVVDKDVHGTLCRARDRARAALNPQTGEAG